MTIEEIYAIPVDGDGWRILPNGNRLHLGSNVKSQIDLAQIGSYAKIGSFAKIGYFAEIGSFAGIGYFAEIGDGAQIGSYAEIGYSAKIGERQVVPCSPLAVQGSRHLAGNYQPGTIQIGCLIHTFEEWRSHFIQIGEAEGYTPEQIEEYGKIIEFLIANGRAQ